MKLGERLEQAIAKANARGMQLELGKPIREYHDYEPHISAPRPRVVGRTADGKAIRIPGVITADGRQTRNSGPPRGFTHEELAVAARGLDQLRLAAVLWCLDYDASARAYLKHELLMRAVDLAERQRWPKKISRRDCELTGRVRCSHRYLQDLCMLALWNGADPVAFRSEVAKAQWFGISDRHWRRSGMAKRYDQLYTMLKSWLDSGIRHIKEGLITRE